MSSQVQSETMVILHLGDGAGAGGKGAQEVLTRDHVLRIDVTLPQGLLSLEYHATDGAGPRFNRQTGRYTDFSMFKFQVLSQLSLGTLFQSTEATANILIS